MNHSDAFVGTKATVLHKQCSNPRDGVSNRTKNISSDRVAHTVAMIRPIAARDRGTNDRGLIPSHAYSSLLRGGKEVRVEGQSDYL